MKFWWQIFKLNCVDICIEHVQAVWAPVPTINPSDAPAKGMVWYEGRNQNLPALKYMKKAVTWLAESLRYTICDDRREGCLNGTNICCDTQQQDPYIITLLSFVCFKWSFSKRLFQLNPCTHFLSEISNSYCGEYEDDCLLGCCAV
jgi:hypothetical protein